LLIDNRCRSDDDPPETVSTPSTTGTTAATTGPEMDPTMALLDAPPRHRQTPSDPAGTTTDQPAEHRAGEHRTAARGMRIRRVRLKSIAKLAFVFWLLAGLILVGTVVVVWNVAQSFGFVESFEETITTSLGLETFEIDGAGIFSVVAGGIAALCVFGWVTTLAMAAVYNAACRVLGGLAVETGPLRRRRRVFSWRHRRFITIAE
jgi:hypothetical protein